MRDHDADPVPEGLDPDPYDPAWVFQVSPGQLQEWYSSRRTFRWRGELFDLAGESEGTVTGYHAGRHLDRVIDHVEQVEQHSFMGTFPLSPTRRDPPTMTSAIPTPDLSPQTIMQLPVTREAAERYVANQALPGLFE
ncbi:hypothetical protein [Phaeacidiphilus oryzae]|uniref:hypothetical protein n=1 Tax=Phaeacidiphilus oryzae TaxID=348818 RepID=UPI000562EC74|nr:hypothetical protein [Phaeacidiphilus oryzae]